MRTTRDTGCSRASPVCAGWMSAGAGVVLGAEETTIEYCNRTTLGQAKVRSTAPPLASTSPSPPSALTVAGNPSSATSTSSSSTRPSPRTPTPKAWRCDDWDLGPGWDLELELGLGRLHSVFNRKGRSVRHVAAIICRKKYRKLSSAARMCPVGSRIVVRAHVATPSPVTRREGPGKSLLRQRPINFLRVQNSNPIQTVYSRSHRGTGPHSDPRRR